VRSAQPYRGSTVGRTAWKSAARPRWSCRCRCNGCANIAHAGDGNLHPLLITRPGDESARLRAQAAFHDIITEALALGGTVTGEHGVGLLKRDGLCAEVGPEVMALNRAVKDALDPRGLLNPGKVLPRH